MSNSLTLLAEEATLGPLDDSDEPQELTPEGATEEAGQPASDKPKTPDWMNDFADVSDPVDLLARISKSVSREELLKDPTLAGIIGDTADKLERKRAADRQAENDRLEAERRERERIERLEAAAEDDDLLTLGELTKEQILEQRERRIRDNDEAERQQEAAQRFQSTAKGTLDQWIDRQDPELRQQLQALAQTNGARYQSLEWNEGFTTWFGDVIATNVRHAQSKWEKDLRESIRMEVLGEIEASQGDATPEVGSGGSAVTSGLVTQAEWDANRHDAAWRRSNLERLNRSLAAGSIRS